MREKFTQHQVTGAEYHIFVKSNRRLIMPLNQIRRDNGLPEVTEEQCREEITVFAVESAKRAAHKQRGVTK